MIRLPEMGRNADGRDPRQMAQWAVARWEGIQKSRISGREETKKAIDLTYRLLQQVTLLATEDEGIEFPTLFSRLAYLKSRDGLPGALLFALQSFRKQVEQRGNKFEEADLLNLGLWSMAELIYVLWGKRPNILDDGIREAKKLLRARREYRKYTPLMRGVLTGSGEEEETLLFLSEDDTETEYVVCWNVAERNEVFSENIRKLLQANVFPYSCHLWHVEIDEDGRLYPQAFIFEPDYLVNVTAIAACFTSEGVDLLPYFLQKFLPRDTSAPLLKGHIANHFFDGLLRDPDSPFLPLLKETFAMYPLEYALLDEGDMRKVYEDVKQFYAVIKSVIKQHFPRLKLDAEHAVIEPSFYHPDLGLQGRLDMLHLSEPDQPNAIIELKSGSVFKPNRYGLQAAHYVQTLLYDLMISHALPKDPSALSYILYCKKEDRPLRSAPVAREQQVEALQLRNRIVLWEQMLSRMTGSSKDLEVFNYLHPKKHDVAGFVGRDLHKFSSVFQSLHKTEQAYFAVFTGFLAREHILAKVGRDQSDRNYGLAAMWRESLPQKQERFGVLNALELLNHRREKEHELVFRRSSETDALANFRVGDIGVLYSETKGQLPTKGQVYKCSVIEMTSTEVVVRLRNWQLDLRAFESGSRWNIEHDMLDSSFYKSFRNLFLWASATSDQRRLYLGLLPPAKGSASNMGQIERPPIMTDQQFRILQKMIQSEDYFLLWGPPGTGKTSVMLRYFVEYMLSQTEERILLLAYTNRAVDEICQTLEKIGDTIEVPYVRLGSTYGVAPEFRSRLLQKQMADVSSRRELKEFLPKQRIYTATVSSFMGKRHLLDLVQFDRVVIDEASQLLEPMMGGIIHDFKRIIMIGDHRQLPAVVQQSAAFTRVRNPRLREIGFRDLGDSLFERLFRKVQGKGWDHAYDQLSSQGRMHPEIMTFPAKHFYDGKLSPLEGIFEKKGAGNGSNQNRFLSRERLIYWASTIREEEQLKKTNKDEAEKVVFLIRAYQQIWKSRGNKWSETSLGVITPFRAQIAQIKKEIWDAGIEDPEKINVDTVERYQGSARDIIIMSLCVNRSEQWSSICSINTEGVDRKLNVAVTRAREHFILIGNEGHIRDQDIYNSLVTEMAYFEEVEISE
ncbi:MAG: AAA family ATPase [Bacteroidetes bacterium]|jgi:DNA replication ATP-dependent helicase Dna2|nr:AAA family ATPase [Bacteroidota bacterium]